MHFQLDQESTDVIGRGESGRSWMKVHGPNHQNFPHFVTSTFTRLAYLKLLLKPFLLDDRIWWCLWSLGRNLWCKSDSSPAISCLQDRTNCEECYFYQYFLYWCYQSDCRSCWAYNVCLLSILWSKEQGSTDSPQPKNFVWRPFGLEIPDKDNAMGKRMGSNDPVFDLGNIIAIPGGVWTIHGISFCWNSIDSV